MQVMPTLAWCFVCDGLTAVQGGVLRGAGEKGGHGNERGYVLHRAHWLDGARIELK